MSVDVWVQAFGVADMLKDPSSKVGQAAVLRQHEPWPGVTLGHIQGWDSHSTPNLMHNINLITLELLHLSRYIWFCSLFIYSKCATNTSIYHNEKKTQFSDLFKYFWSVFWREWRRWWWRCPSIVMTSRWDGVHGFSCVVVELQGVAGGGQQKGHVKNIHLPLGKKILH